MLSSARAFPSVMRSLVVSLLISCGSSSSPEHKQPPPQPTPVAPIALDAAPPALSPELRAKWEHGCFMLKTPAGLVESDHARCTTPRIPYSTFKLANALVALDLGILDGPDAPMTWDKKAVPDQPAFLDAWRKDHTLRSAMKVSAVPHFRTLARTIGEQRMAAGLAKLDYGNRNIGGGIDQFWLRGALRITAEQQLAFVDKLAHGTLAVSATAQATVRDVTTLDTKDKHVLHGKTGSGPATDLDKNNEGKLVWQVGWIDNGSEITPYAAWVEVPTRNIDEARATRDELLKTTLAALGVF
jgi:beta-lactamase class D